MGTKQDEITDGLMTAWYGPKPFDPKPPEGGGGKSSSKGTDALNEARAAQGKQPEGGSKAKDGKGEGRAQKGKKKGKVGPGKRGGKDGGGGAEPGDGGHAEVVDFEEIERKLEAEKRKRRRGY